MANTRKKPRSVATKIGKKPRTAVLGTRVERAAAGQALRDAVPTQEPWCLEAAADGRDPIQILEKSNRGRLPEFVPIRYRRMVLSPFTFLRGSAAVMAPNHGRARWEPPWEGAPSF